MSIGECIEWEGRRNEKGYGLVGGGNVKAHRLAYEKTHGPIPKGMVVMHRCDNPPCVNPDHLTVGTHKDNVRDCIDKGRRRYATRDTLRNAKLTSADRGEILALRRSGWSFRELADKHMVSVSTMHAFIRSDTVATPTEKVYGDKSLKSWSEWQDLNLRPPRPEGEGLL